MPLCECDVVVVEPIPTQVLEEDTPPIQIDLDEVFDSVNDLPLTYEIADNPDLNELVGATIEDNILTIAPNEDAVGNEEVAIIATDPNDVQAIDDFTTIIEEVDDPIALKEPISEVIFDPQVISTTIDLTCFFEDPDSDIQYEVEPTDPEAVNLTQEDNLLTIERISDEPTGTELIVSGFSFDDPDTVLEETIDLTVEEGCSDEETALELDLVDVFGFTRGNDNLYTSKPPEADSLDTAIASGTTDYEAMGLVYQGFAEDPSLDPVYRLYNTTAGTHFYTTSESEKNSIVDSLDDFVFEGIEHYAVANPEDVMGIDTIPMHRYYDTVNGGHTFRLTDDLELQGDRYLSEGQDGIAFYVAEAV